MNIREAIQDALKYFDDPPPNEASTCEWVILPLLHAAGYDRRDILSHVSDGGRGFPDYTILPKDEQHKFYLEAKAWLVMLEDGHARQSLNYANGDGKRWVVLTNGQEWRLYDNDRRGLPEEKLVAKVQLKDSDEAEKFLQAIGKQSVCTGKLEVYAKTALEAKRQRQEAQALAEECNVQLSKPESALVKAMHLVLAQCEGLRELKLEGIVAHFARKPPGASQPPASNGPKAGLGDSRGLGDEGPEPVKQADRPYWEKLNNATLEIADEVLVMLRSFDSSLDLSYNKAFIGLTRQGKANNFVVFHGLRKRASLSIRLPQSEDVDRMFADAEIDLMPYLPRHKTYRPKISKSELAENGDLFRKVLEMANKNASKPRRG